MLMSSNNLVSFITFLPGPSLSIQLPPSSKGGEIDLAIYSCFSANVSFYGLEVALRKYIGFSIEVPPSLQGREIDLGIYISLNGAASLYGLGVFLP